MPWGRDDLAPCGNTRTNMTLLASFVIACPKKKKVRLGATVCGLVHLPYQLAQAGKTGDILKQLLRKRGHYVALVSTMEDALAEQPKVVTTQQQCATNKLS